MAHIWATNRAPGYERFKHPTPSWFKDGKFGIFVHYGPYAVPAWAIPTGKLGEIPEEELHANNPYAEWYYNTIRFPGCPAQKHHEEVYKNAPYDQFLDHWKAPDFNAQALMKVFKRAGAKYFVPVVKHHDGVTLWEAPGDGGRNTVQRGPKRDFVAEWAEACKAEDIRFGIYYSTGIDWHFYPTKEPWSANNYDRPGIDAHDYNEYAFKQCADLIEKYHPFLLWGDIDWPKAGVAEGPYSLDKLLDKFYQARPDGVINDRFGDTHWDFKTVEYSMGAAPAVDEAWQYTRGIGLSFGYNQVEDEGNSINGRDALHDLINVCSKGGNFFLNVGPDAAGNIPDIQLNCLTEIGDWMEVNKGSIFATKVVPESLAEPSEGDANPWVRWHQSDGKLYGFSDGDRQITAKVDNTRVKLGSAALMTGEKVDMNPKDGTVTLILEDVPTELRPVCVQFDLA